jgi:hypothetical protein
MPKIRSKISEIEKKYYIEIEKQLLDYLGLKRGDDVEFDLRKAFTFADRIIDENSEAKVKLIPTCFEWGAITLRTRDRHLFPNDKHPFLLEVDGKLEKRHVASMKISMGEFFYRHEELKKKDFMIIKIIKPFEEYKLEY